MKNNAFEILANVEACISELEAANKNPYAPSRTVWKGYTNKKVFKIRTVCEELSIFDWWNDNLSMSQLNAMRSFLKTAIELGFTGYVCFKVGAKYCSHGMWASKKDREDRTPGDELFHSFRAGDNYWSYAVNGKWTEQVECSLADVKKAFA